MQLFQMHRGLFALYLVLGSLFILGGATKCTQQSVRKEWRSLSQEDRGHWITAVKCLANSPNDDVFVSSLNPPDIAPYNASGSLFDDIVYAHMNLNHRIHWNGLFLPWHRWYLFLFDSLLRSHCGYRGPLPYWDWTKDAADFYESPFFKDSDPESGLGGWGDASTGFRVLDGAFSASSSFQLSYPFPHTLRRNYTLIPQLDVVFPVPGLAWNHTRPGNASFTKPVVESLIDGFVGDYKGFQARMEGVEGPHLNVHFTIGGDVAGACPVDAPAGCISGPTFSSNDPLFFLHHAMLDRIWFKWQKKHNLNKNAFEGGSVQHLENASAFGLYPTGGPPYLTVESELPTVGLSAPFIVANMISTTEWPLCYVYD
ncbi:Di-copper centre-containing protein [Mycena olivaceomarginata]|nr:Di-copper centre-containing protein [Mycena olivaceomarginata]